jgi:hypothetical protein
MFRNLCVGVLVPDRRIRLDDSSPRIIESGDEAKELRKSLEGGSGAATKLESLKPTYGIGIDQVQTVAHNESE